MERDQKGHFQIEGLYDEIHEEFNWVAVCRTTSTHHKQESVNSNINPSQPRNQTNSGYSPLHVCRKDPSIWREAVVLIVEPLR